MKRVIQISLFVLFAAAAAGLMGFIYIEQGKQPVSDVVIHISRSTPDGFLDTAIVRQAAELPDSLYQIRVRDIPVRKIEKSVSKNPFVENADVYVNIDNQLIINIKEKKPVLRVFNRGHKGFYINNEGNIFPLSNHYTSRVVIANGYFDVPYQNGHSSIFDTVYRGTPLVDLFTLTQLIRKNKFLNAQISQVYVNSRGEYDLVPELGNHLIRFGTMKNASGKLQKLELFYKKALIKEGWDKYGIINLKYKNQVVCEKK